MSNCVVVIIHYSNGIISTMASQITDVSVVMHNCLFRGRSKKTSKFIVTDLYEGNPPHKEPVTRKIFPFDDVIMIYQTQILTPLHTINCKSLNSKVFQNLKPGLKIKSINIKFIVSMCIECMCTCTSDMSWYIFDVYRVLPYVLHGLLNTLIRINS